LASWTSTPLMGKASGRQDPRGLLWLGAGVDGVTGQGR